MITNDRQYKIAKSALENFQQSLEMLSLSSKDIDDVHPLILKAEKDAINYQMRELSKELEEYELLKSGETFVAAVNNLSELPIVLIKSRIANRLTQAELADKLGMKEQQIQKYEAELYASASLRTLCRIAEALEIKINADVQIKQVDPLASLDVNRYPFKQMFKRNWFPEFQGKLNEAIKESPTLIAGLFQKAGIDDFQYALNRISVRSTASLNQDALNVWYARVIIKAREQELETFFDKLVVNEIWLKNLAMLSLENEGPRKAVQYLQNEGIRVVFEEQLEGTYLDGAALLLDKLFPVIALTLRHDRLDNFWFVLFHELAHVMLHLGADLDTIFDDLDTSIDGIESEADQYALNAAIPDSIWKKSLVRFSPSKQTIINQAKALKIHAALVAGRIRRETGKYYLFSDMIGQNEVRKLFINEIK